MKSTKNIQSLLPVFTGHVAETVVCTKKLIAILKSLRFLGVLVLSAYLQVGSVFVAGLSCWHRPT